MGKAIKWSATMWWDGRCVYVAGCGAEEPVSTTTVRLVLGFESVLGGLMH